MDLFFLIVCLVFDVHSAGFVVPLPVVGADLQWRRLPLSIVDGKSSSGGAVPEG